LAPSPATSAEANEKGLVERPIGLCGERFCPAAVPRTCSISRQGSRLARNPLPTTRVPRHHRQSTRPVFEHDERQAPCGLSGESRSIPDDVDTVPQSAKDLSRPFSTASLYSVPPHLVDQCVLVRGTDHDVSCLPRPQARRPRMRAAGTPTRTNEAPRPPPGRPGPKSLAASPDPMPPALVGRARRFRASVTSKSWLLARAALRRESVRLTFLVEAVW